MQDHAEVPTSDGDAVTVVPAQVADPVLIEQVDAAVLGDPLEDSPEAQPDRVIEPVDFPSFYIRHRSSLAMHARRFLKDSHDVEDVVQETFIKLFLAIPEIETELQALAFSRRVITNLCIDRYRAAKRRPNLVNLDATLSTGFVAIEDELVDPVVQAEDAAIVRQALSLLSPIHRAALVKREIEEKTLSVIAAELGVSDESVKHLLFRARRALRRLLVGTAVDPAAPLHASEVAELAQARLGRAIVGSARYVVVVLVLIATALVAAGVTHGTSGGSGATRVAEPAAPVLGTLGSPAGTARPSRHPRAKPRPAAHSVHSASVGPAASSAAQHTAGVVAPTEHHAAGSGHKPPPSKAPTKPPTTSPGTGTTPVVPPAPHLKFSGDLPLAAGQEPAIANAQTVPSASGQQLVSQFIAPTQDGNLVLGQLVTPGASASTTPISLTAQFPVAGQTVSTATFASSSASATLPDDEAAFDGTLDVVVPTPASTSGDSLNGPTPPATAHIAVSMIVNLADSSLVSESVMVTSTPPPSSAVSAPPVAATGSTQNAAATLGGSTVDAADSRLSPTG